MADAAAQLHILQSKSPVRWSNFIESNCAECALRPDTCSFLNPTQEMCPAGVGAAEVKGGTAMQIERGRITVCPAKTNIEGGK